MTSELREDVLTPKDEAKGRPPMAVPGNCAVILKQSNKQNKMMDLKLFFFNHKIRMY